ncbi:MAG: alpha-2-macroglobulin, partial [Methylobacterium sp.]
QPSLGAIDPEVIALDGEGKPVKDLALTIKLIHRQWNSTLQASDFAQGSAKYQTEVIDDVVAERRVTSGAEPIPVHFGASEAGVYVVEVSAQDRVGRTQTVKVDLFMAGDTPVTWQAPPAQTVTLSTDKPRYAPGETATLLVQSPFQTGRALAVVEEPEGRFRYDWVDIANGFGRYAVPIRKAQTPKLTVHMLLMRGRLPGPINPAAPFDQGKPVTLAATTSIAVSPVENRLQVSFDAPAQARPAQEFDLVLHLADAAGRPVAGEATVWMVDQAVLALAKEAPLDPLPAFLVDRPARMVARDTRNMAFGVIPLAEAPGGDEAGDFGMENISVRKNFTPVPLYQPRVKVGPDGTARIHVKLPDTLTVFMLRAEAVSGPDRFGFGTGQLKVRQPIVAQPSLPRFVRPGDSFT